MNCQLRRSFRRFLANVIIKVLSNHLSGIWETSPQQLLLLPMINTPWLGQIPVGAQVDGDAERSALSKV